MTIQDITTLISTVGFPVVVCGFLLYKFQKTQEDIVQTIASLNVLINKIYEEVTNK